LDSLRVGNRCKALFTEFLNGFLIFSKIEFGTDQDAGRIGSVMVDLGIPLCPDVLKRRRAHEREANNENIGLRIREGPQSIVVLLASGIPKTKADWFMIHHDICRVIVEYGRNIFAGECISSVTNQKAGLTNGTIPDYDAFYRLHE